MLSSQTSQMMYVLRCDTKRAAIYWKFEGKKELTLTEQTQLLYTDLTIFF